ncbi:MAG: RluA family pseudouridine synthase [Pseudomonadota bacterium]
MASDHYTLTWEGPGPERLDKVLVRLVPEAASLSRARIARLIEAGQVAVEGQSATQPKTRVQPGQSISLDVPVAAPSEIGPEAIALSILHEDLDLLVVDKPAGMVVHPAPGNPSGTLVNALMAHLGAGLSSVGGVGRPGIVHRIDKDTSGLLVVAKSDRAHHGLAAQFAAHSAERRYLAVCHGVPSAADARLSGLPGVSFETGGVVKVATQIGRHRTDRQRQAALSTGGKHAVTRLRVREDFGAVALIECWLETGRTHQIRVHLAHIGHALIGDSVYGRGRKLQRGYEGVVGFERQALHAATLGFAHPARGEVLRFESALPADMQSLLNTLRTEIGQKP